jgi:hypothetical protein
VYVEDDEYVPNPRENMEEDGDDEDMQIDERRTPFAVDDDDESLLLLIKEITLGRPPVDETDSATSAEDTDTMSEEEDMSDEEFLYDPSDDTIESTRGVSPLNPQEATDIRYRE